MEAEDKVTQQQVVGQVIEGNLIKIMTMSSPTPNYALIFSLPPPNR